MGVCRQECRYTGSTPLWRIPPVCHPTEGIYHGEMPSPPNTNRNRVGWHLQVRLTVPFICPRGAEDPGAICFHTNGLIYSTAFNHVKATWVSSSFICGAECMHAGSTVGTSVVLWWSAVQKEPTYLTRTQEHPRACRGACLTRHVCNKHLDRLCDPECVAGDSLVFRVPSLGVSCFPELIRMSEIRGECMCVVCVV